MCILNEELSSTYSFIYIYCLKTSYVTVFFDICKHQCCCICKFNQLSYTSTFFITVSLYFVKKSSVLFKKKNDYLVSEDKTKRFVTLNKVMTKIANSILMLIM